MNDDLEHPDLSSRKCPVREDMAYQMKVWRFERWGWYVLVLLMVLGLSGLFSRGLLSSRDIRSEDGRVRVEYEMFHRNGSTNSMKISLGAAPESTVELELAGEMLEGFSIETLQPVPLRARSSAEGIRLWVQTDTQGQADLFITLRGDGLGWFRSRIVLPGTSDVPLNQFIFP
ncbi:hypothetical protein SAMN04489798_4368 [Pseudomonas arsenicoxydans]|uniref:Uncharacterized protein n=1 Tax=Pseudomonas arsenicoxydans TaxID=702115 RepID=A0A1H0P0M3_9PSED|nr:hypothetical protein [Pseudomonas arsenicoxydans]SDO98306.1 hypothetical protein SAMN04489798_4368 [Pseudomonas arsenicoxydans]